MFISYHATGAPGSDFTDTMQEDMSTKKTELSTVSSTETQHLPKSGISQGMVASGYLVYRDYYVIFVFSPYIRKFSSYFHLQVITEFTELNM